MVGDKGEHENARPTESLEKSWNGKILQILKLEVEKIHNWIGVQDLGEKHTVSISGPCTFE